MLLILFVQIVYAFYPTVNEYIKYDMRDIFGTLTNATYSGSNQQCSIYQSLQQIKYSEHPQTSNIIDLKCFQEYCVFLDNKNILHWTSETLVSETPQFLYTKQLEKQCYDFDFIDDSTIIVDCIDEKQYNYFYFIQIPKDSIQSKLFEKNDIQPQQLTYRKINVFDQDHFLIGEQNTTISYINLYSLEDMKKLDQTIDTQLLSKLASLKQFKFKLIDFVVRFGLLYILDETRLFVLAYNKEWKLNTQLLLPNKAVAFDVNIISDLNGNEKFELIVLTQNGNLLHYEDFTHQPLSIQLYGQSVQISNQFIIVQDNSNIILIDIHNNIIITDTQWSQKKFIVSPLNSILIAVTNTQTQKYLLSYGYLICKSPITTLQYTLTLDAQYGQQQNKSVKITYQFIAQNDQTLYQIGDPIIFRNAISSSPYYEYITPFVSGPNIQYQATNQSDYVKIGFFNQMWEDTLIFPHNTIYQDTLMIGSTESLILFQGKDYTISLWGCNTYVPKDQCGYLSMSFEVKLQLTKQNFNWWQYNGDVYIAFTSKQNEVEVWELSITQLQKIQTIRFKTQIQQILGSKNNLYVLQNDGNLDIYQNGQLLNSIELADPIQKIYINPYYMNEILIIQTQTYFVITRYHHEISVIEYFSNSNDDVYVAIYENSFIIVTSLQISEYYLTADSTQLLRTLPFYDYKISNQITQSKHNGLLFILASKYPLNYILVYKPQQLAHDSLYQIIELSALSTLQDVIISADGHHSTEVFYQDSGTRAHFIVLESTQIIALISQDSNQYCQQVNDQIKVYNQQTQLQFNSELKLINRMEHINIIDNNYNEILLGEQQNAQFISLGNTWYRGQVVNFKITCKQCPELVSIQEPITLNNYNLYQNVKLIQRYDSTHQVIITSNTLIIVDNYLKQTSNLYIGQEAYKIAINDNYILLAIQKDKYTSLIMIQCKSPYSCQFTAEKTTNYQTIDQMILNDMNFLFISSNGKLTINYVTYDDQKWSFELKQTFNIQDYQPCQGINYFTVQSIYTNTYPDYIISILDKTGNILFFFFQLSNQNLKLLTNSVQQLNLIIEDLQQYTQQDTQFIKIISLAPFQKTVTGNLLMKFLIITDNVASYALNFLFNHMTYIYEKTELIYVVNQYGDWKATQNSYLDWGKLCMHYTNGIKNVILYYILPNTQTQQISQITTLTSIDGLSDSQSNDKVIVYIYNNSNGQYLFSNIENRQSVSNYLLDTTPIFTVSNTIELDLKQTINVIVSNDFSSSYKQFTLRSLVEPVKESSSAGWIIFVTVFAGVLSIVLLLYVLRRRSIRQSFENYQPMVDQQLRNL